ncbi:MAG: Ribosomal RNA small subunit methyltransferase D [Chlamydiales bacterium]|nr:Ribosomal RNA small subunit methyltransferase D [Chlamydiales bacterium]MCH9636179.1 Ribosomal RNA small subunit methyltransferase D [Chlamydiales bacterium]
MITIIAGKYKKRRLATPKGETTRPTLSKVRESLFNILQSEIEEATFLDLFAGAGTIGFEALSRGARQVTFIEQNRAAIKSIEANIRMLEVQGQTKLIKKNLFPSLEYLTPFDIIFADPPYGRGFGEKVVQAVVKYGLLKNVLFVEEDHELPEQEGVELVSCRKIGRTFLHRFHNVSDLTN